MTGLDGRIKSDRDYNATEDLRILFNLVENIYQERSNVEIVRTSLEPEDETIVEKIDGLLDSDLGKERMCEKKEIGRIATLGFDKFPESRLLYLLYKIGILRLENKIVKNIRKNKQYIRSIAEDMSGFRNNSLENIQKCKEARKNSISVMSSRRDKINQCRGMLDKLNKDNGDLRKLISIISDKVEESKWRRVYAKRPDNIRYVFQLVSNFYFGQAIQVLPYAQFYYSISQTNHDTLHCVASDLLGRAEREKQGYFGLYQYPGCLENSLKKCEEALQKNIFPVNRSCSNYEKLCQNGKIMTDVQNFVYKTSFLLYWMSFCVSQEFVKDMLSRGNEDVKTGYFLRKFRDIMDSNIVMRIVNNLGYEEFSFDSCTLEAAGTKEETVTGADFILIVDIDTDECQACWYVVVQAKIWQNLSGTLPGPDSEDQAAKLHAQGKAGAYAFYFIQNEEYLPSIILAEAHRVFGIERPANVEQECVDLPSLFASILLDNGQVLGSWADTFEGAIQEITESAKTVDVRADSQALAKCALVQGVGKEFDWDRTEKLQRSLNMSVSKGREATRERGPSGREPSL